MVNLDEFAAAIHLLSADGWPPYFEQIIKLGMEIVQANGLIDYPCVNNPHHANVIKAAGWKKFCLNALENSPFELEARERIADAVAQHDKLFNESNDSLLLAVLRIASRLEQADNIPVDIRRMLDLYYVNAEKNCDVCQY
jgi:hypothetical protein